MMENNRKSVRLRLEVRVFVVFLVFSSFGLCWSLNDEGRFLLRFKKGVVNDPFEALSNWRDDDKVVHPCAWFGVGCSDGKVVSLNLKDLLLNGTLSPELMKLVHLKSIVLHNNSFSGVVPEGIGMLKELMVLDLRCNNLSGPLPSDLDSWNLSQTVMLLDNNKFLGSFSLRFQAHQLLSGSPVDKKELPYSANEVSCWNDAQNKASTHSHRKLLVPFYNPYKKLIGNKSPLVEPPPTAASLKPPSIPGKTFEAAVPNINSPGLPKPPSMPGKTSQGTEPDKRTPAPDISAPPPPSLTSGSLNPQQAKSSSKKRIAIVAGCIGGVVALLMSAAAVFFFRSNAGKPVNPWRTGLSGQLQKALVTGVPKLKRSELESACEDFSNVIGSCPSGTLYKGTLSSGVEIAVGSVTPTSSKEWSESLEMQFWKKVEKLSKVNHKNFVNLLGYCVEEEPFTRMMIFEYAPNGTLFEHLHFKESEHLDWGMRLRVAMGMAYCLDYMHQLNPPISHDHLTSSSIHLAEDYAPKVADFSFWYNTDVSETECSRKKLIDTYAHVATVENNVYSFGVLLFEMMTGRLPYTAGVTESVENWASDYLGGGEEGEGKTLTEIADPSLESFEAEKMEKIEELIKTCVQSDPNQRPAMREVAARLREITGISPDGAIPRLSPLWWAELEVLSTA